MGRTTRWVRSELPFVVVGLAFAVAVVLMALDPGQWRSGTVIMAAALLAAGLFRLLAPPERAGSLTIRSRWWDVVCYLAAGLVILVVDIRLH